jgi:hypothetical protein
MNKEKMRMEISRRLSHLLTNHRAVKATKEQAKSLKNPLSNCRLALRRVKTMRRMRRMRLMSEKRLRN